LIVTYCEKDKNNSYLYLHSINGVLINRVNISGTLSDLVITNCGNYLIHGGDQARSLTVSPLTIVQDWPCIENVQCLSILSKDSLCAGLANGNIKIMRFNTSYWEIRKIVGGNINTV